MKKNQTMAIQAVSRHYSEAISIARWQILHDTKLELDAYLKTDASQRTAHDALWFKRLAVLLQLLFETEVGLYEWDGDGRFHEGKGGSERDYAQVHHDAYQGLAQAYMLPALAQANELPRDFVLEVNDRAARIMGIGASGQLTKQQLQEALLAKGDAAAEALRLALLSTAQGFMAMLDNVYAEARRLEIKAGLIQK